MGLRPDKCANAVDSVMKRFNVKGRGVKFETNHARTRVFVAINTTPSDEDMVFVSNQLQAVTNATVRPGTFKHIRGKVGFLFTQSSGGPSPRLPSPKAPTPSPQRNTYKQFLRQQSDNEARSNIKWRNKKR